MERRRLPSATTDVSAESYRSLSTMDMNEGRSKVSKRFAESFDEHDLARQMIHHAYFFNPLLIIDHTSTENEIKACRHEIHTRRILPIIPEYSTSSGRAKF